MTTGFCRADIKQIALRARDWPGSWAAEITGDVVSPSVVLLPDEVDDAPALHLEQTAQGIVTVAVRGDQLLELGTFSSLPIALTALSELVADGGWRCGQLA